MQESNAGSTRFQATVAGARYFLDKTICLLRITIKILVRPSTRNARASRQQEVMESVLSVLYGASGIAASALYVPQILKYHRDPEARLSISLVAWGGWIAIAVVSILYALYVVKNFLFALVAGLNVVAQLIVLSYGVNARLAGRFILTPGKKPSR